MSRSCDASPGSRVTGARCRAQVPEEPGVRLLPHRARSGQKPLLLSEDRLNRRSSNLHATRRRPHSFRRREHTSSRTFHSFSAYWRLNDFRMTTQHAEVGQLSLQDDVALRLNPSPVHYRRATRFLRDPIPARVSACLMARFPGKETRDPYGLTTFHIRNIRTARDLSLRRCGVAVSVDPDHRESTIRYPQLRASSLDLQRWLFVPNDVYESLLMLSLHVLTLAPRSPLQGSFGLPSRFGLPFPAGTFPSASHPEITPHACDGGFDWLNSRSIAGQFTDATSCRTWSRYFVATPWNRRIHSFSREW